MTDNFKNTRTKKSFSIPTKVILYLYILFNANPLYAQWQIYNTGFQWSKLNDIQFVNELTGYSVGDELGFGLFIKSTNGGANWQKYQISDSSTSIRSGYKVLFLTEEMGFIIGRSKHVYKTNNGGINWIPVDLPVNATSMILNDITFPSFNIGYSSGRYGYIFKTTNNGNSWDTIFKSPISDILTIHFFDNDKGIAGDAFGGIYRTTDGGTNWSYEQLMFDNYIYGYSNMKFISNDIGFMFGYTFSPIPARFLLLKTFDGGISWTPISLFLQDEFIGIHFFDENKGFVTGYGKIKYTDNGGQSWLDIYPNNGAFPESYSSISFVNDEIGILSGTTANVYKTETGGVNIQNISSEIPPGFQLHQNYPNPFNPTTNIKFSIPSTQYTVLKIFDALGREVATLVNETLQAGVYQYQFTTDKYQLPSGVYFYRLRAGEFVETKRLVLIK